MTKDVLFSFIFFFPISILEKNGLQMQCKNSSIETIRAFTTVNMKSLNKNIKNTPSLFNIRNKWQHSKLSTDKGFHKKYIWQPW